jgi:PAS domain S-box-containing protein
MKNKSAIASQLRNDAERTLRTEEKSGRSGKPVKADEIFHELQIYQVELEMQNEELRTAQVELEEEKQKFAALFDLAPVGYFVLDGVAAIVKCNEAATALLELSRVKLTNRRFSFFIVPEDVQVFYSFLYKLISNSKHQCEVRMRKSDNQVIHVGLEGSMIYNSKSEARYYIAAFDITTKKAAEKKQAELNERLQMALGTSDMGTLKICFNTGKADLDDYAREIMCCGDIDGEYSSFLNLVAERDRKLVDRSIRAAITGEATRVEFRLKKESDKYLEMKGNFRMLDDQTFFIGVVCDITSTYHMNKKMEELKSGEQIKMMQAVIEAQEKERARLSNSLHDGLAQLLYALQMNLQVRTGHQLPHESIANAQKLVSDAIRETRNISFELTPSCLADYGLKTALLDMLHRISLPALKFSCSLKGFEKRLNSQSELFVYRVVQELCNNILKHSKATESFVEVHYVNGTLNLKVSDNGIGIKPRQIEKPGSGLCSVMNRVKLFNGVFDIRKGSSGGTEITVQIKHFT